MFILHVLRKFFRHKLIPECIFGMTNSLVNGLNIGYIRGTQTELIEGINMSKQHNARIKGFDQTSLRRKPIWIAITLAMSLQSQLLSAQSNDTDEEPDMVVQEETGAQLDRLQVTGTRNVIQNSIDEKRNSTEVVEALTADDIGDIPARQRASARLAKIRLDRDFPKPCAPPQSSIHVRKALPA